jgi:hypothetical protein
MNFRRRAFVAIPVGLLKANAQHSSGPSLYRDKRAAIR